MTDKEKIIYVQDRLATITTPLPSDTNCLKLYEIAESAVASGIAMNLDDLFMAIIKSIRAVVPPPLSAKELSKLSAKELWDETNPK